MLVFCSIGTEPTCLVEVFSLHGTIRLVTFSARARAACKREGGDDSVEQEAASCTSSM
jgi:hypothetical protein